MILSIAPNACGVCALPEKSIIKYPIPLLPAMYSATMVPISENISPSFTPVIRYGEAFGNRIFANVNSSLVS